LRNNQYKILNLKSKMDYTMNNLSLDELVKRDKKLGRISGGRGGKPN